MNPSLSGQLLDLTAGAFLLAAVGVVWRRELRAIVGCFAAQGIALAGLIGVLAAEERSAELAVVAVGIAALRAALLPYLIRRTLTSDEDGRESRLLVNVPASLVAVAVLAVVGYAVSRPVVALSTRPAAQAVPVALTVVFVGLFVLVTRRKAVSQVVGFLLVDNGITALAFLTTSGVPLVVELGVSLDVLLAVLVLLALTGRLRAAFGHTDLDDMRELRDR